MSKDSNREVEDKVKQLARDVVQVVVANWPEYNIMTGRERNNLFDGIKPILHHQLQKAREEEKERIEEVFKKHVPPHAMDLEDSVWLKRLLNKAFNHNQNV